MKGSKTGGRKKGSPNKRTTDVFELVSEKYPNFNPLLSMVAISEDQSIDINVRVSCLKEVSGYMFPKRKSIEVDSTIKHDIQNKQLSPTLEKMLDRIIGKVEN